MNKNYNFKTFWKIREWIGEENMRYYLMIKVYSVGSKIHYWKTFLEKKIESVRVLFPQYIFYAESE